MHNYCNRTANQILSGQGLAWRASEVIPDSEEERERLRAEEAGKIIEISSESDDEDCTSITMSPTKPSVPIPQTPNPPKRKSYTAYRQTIPSSDEDSDIEIRKYSAFVRLPEVEHLDETIVNSTGPFQPPEIDSIIVFDEPRGVAKPLRVRVRNKEPSSDIPPVLSDMVVGITDASRGGIVPSSTQVAGPSKVSSTPVSRSTGGNAASFTPPPKTEKAKMSAKQTMLHSYAENLFSDLNKTVFKSRLPANTKLHWNKRLLKTAGRAKYHRSRDGIETVEIELAEKILDSEERIRNTLSHEMCHLATWVIDGKVDEHHGKLFMTWASLVMKSCPNIHVSVRHDYEITYPFQWKCQKCDKIYGRFSKSIRPELCVCGACKEGKLIPLFKSNRRKRDGTNVSKFAATNAQDSPRALLSPTSVDTLTDTDSDSAVEVLAGTLAGASITL